MKARGNKSSKAVIAERQSQVLEKLKEGQTETEIAAEIGVSLMTLYRYLRSLDATFAAENQEALRELKKKVGEALLGKAQQVEEGKLAPDQANAWRAIISDFSKLMGLNAESRHVNVNVTVEPEKLRLFDRFMLETRSFSSEDYEKVWTFCRELIATKPPVVYGPPSDSPLWHDDEEDEELKKLTEWEGEDEGEPDENS